MSETASGGKILVTGGLGYIGAHIAIDLIGAGYEIIIVDNSSNSSLDVLDKIKKLVPTKSHLIYFENIDLRNEDALNSLFEQHSILAVIHLAGFKAVGESVEDPLLYYDNNVGGMVSLLKAMKSHAVRNILFSSSATVYGEVDTPCLSENLPTNPFNPYGRTKWMVEHMLFDLQNSNDEWNATSLRYFNPAGAHPSGLIGDRIDNRPNNLFPIICQVLSGYRTELNVYGNDYKTRDGTGERDYIHVCDLAESHIAALEHLLNTTPTKTTHIFNIGSGRGYTVLEVIRAFEDVLGKDLPYSFSKRRAGDIDRFYADPSRANKILAWQTKHDLKQMCIDTCRWLEAAK